MKRCEIPVSVGELLDKVVILEIKSERIDDPRKLANVRRELELLRQAFGGLDLKEDGRLAKLTRGLKEVNERLWDIEDAIRLKESQGAFDEQFIELARAVYRTNDRRAELKYELNRLTGSELVEEKSYTSP